MLFTFSSDNHGVSVRVCLRAVLVLLLFIAAATNEASRLIYCLSQLGWPSRVAGTTAHNRQSGAYHWLYTASR